MCLDIPIRPWSRITEPVTCEQHVDLLRCTTRHFELNPGSKAWAGTSLDPSDMALSLRGKVCVFFVFVCCYFHAVLLILSFIVISYLLVYAILFSGTA